MDGKLPVVLKTLAWLSAEVRKSTSSAASLGCLLCLGTVRWLPPELPAPPGIAAMSHLPAAFLAWSWMYAVIQAGQTTVAKVPLLKPVFHSGVNAAIFAERPAWIIWTDRSQARFTSGLVATTMLSFWSYTPTGACAMIAR